jgi:hypothetical protein
MITGSFILRAASITKKLPSFFIFPIAGGVLVFAATSANGFDFIFSFGLCNF